MLLLPESGLLFWMLLSFGIVVFVLVKFGFPVIIKMVEDRKTFIEDSLLLAQKAKDEMEHLKIQSEKILGEARNEHARIIQEANVVKERIIQEAEQKAILTAESLIENAKVQIEVQKNKAMLELRKEIADISLGLTEKVLRKQLENKKEQKDFIHQLMEDVTKS